MDWESSKAKAEYIAGGTSYRKLAEKYGVSLSVLRCVAQREDWVNLREQAQHKTDTEIVRSAAKSNAKKAKDIIDVADLLLSKVKEVAESIPLDTKSIKELTSALKDLKDIKGYKSAKDLEEQNARIKKLKREAERDDDTTSEVEVIFNAGPEAWNE